MPDVTAVTVRAERTQTLFVWLLAATFLPAVVTVGSAAVGAMPPVRLVALLFGVAHVPTTFAVLADPDMRPFVQTHTMRCVVVPALLIVGAATAAVVASDQTLAWLIAAFTFWQIHHFTKQNLGMVSFWCRANQLPGSDPTERRLIIATGVAGMCGIARFLPAYAGGEVPGAEALWYLGAVVLIVTGTVLVARSPGRRVPLAAVALFFSPLFLFPGNLEAAVLGFVAAHGAQYFLMVGHLAWPHRWLRWVVVWSAIVGYLLMTAPSSGVLWGAVFGVTMAHFVIDAGMWRMRDPERRRYIASRFTFL